MLSVLPRCAITATRYAVRNAERFAADACARASRWTRPSATAAFVEPTVSTPDVLHVIEATPHPESGAESVTVTVFVAQPLLGAGAMDALVTGGVTPTSLCAVAEAELAVDVTHLVARGLAATRTRGPSTSSRTSSIVGAPPEARMSLR